MEDLKRFIGCRYEYREGKRTYLPYMYQLFGKREVSFEDFVDFIRKNGYKVEDNYVDGLVNRGVPEGHKSGKYDDLYESVWGWGEDKMNAGEIKIKFNYMVDVLNKLDNKIRKLKLRLK